MVQEAHISEDNGLGPKPAHRGKSGEAKYSDAATSPEGFFRNFDPQKIFPFTGVKKGDFDPLFEANIEMMRALDGMFQSWASGFSSRNQERIHTLEECAKCGSEADAMKLQSDCMQRLTKHWMDDNQKLGGIFFDAVGKVAKESNGWMMSAMKKAGERVKTD
jgi:hypothetical protein